MTKKNLKIDIVANGPDDNTCFWDKSPILTNSSNMWARRLPG